MVAKTYGFALPDDGVDFEHDEVSAINLDCDSRKLPQTPTDVAKVTPLNFRKLGHFGHLTLTHNHLSLVSKGCDDKRWQVERKLKKAWHEYSEILLQAMVMQNGGDIKPPLMRQVRENVDTLLSIVGSVVSLDRFYFGEDKTAEIDIVQNAPLEFNNRYAPIKFDGEWHPYDFFIYRVYRLHIGHSVEYLNLNAAGIEYSNKNPGDIERAVLAGITETFSPHEIDAVTRKFTQSPFSAVEISELAQRSGQLVSAKDRHVFFQQPKSKVWMRVNPNPKQRSNLFVQITLC